MLPPTAFVSFLQNHDQVGNRAFGERIAQLAAPEAVRAAAAILLLAPAPPLLFMGEEWACRQPFPFFCDFEPDLAARVREGRRREFERFPAFRDPEARARIPDPCADETFESAVLRWADRESEAARLHLDLVGRLLDLRRREIVPRLRAVAGGAAAYEVGAGGVLTVRWRLGDGTRLGLQANLRDSPATAPVEPASGGRRLLFATPEPPADGVLAPWSVAWWLADAE
jgi:1,4-alpha-glucan branching enzyme